MDKEKKQFENFLIAQKKYIENAKYMEGIHVNHDPGDEYIIKWIAKNAKKFRNIWENCQCRDCKNACKCGDCLKIECENFIELL